MLAAEAGNEASAANLAARLQLAVHAHQIAPGRELRLSLQEGPEYHAIALEQRARDGLDVVGLSEVSSDHARGFHQPAPLLGGASSARNPRSCPPSPRPRRKLGKAALDECRQQSGCADQLVKERRAALCERFADRFRLGRESETTFFLDAPMAGVLAKQQRDRRGAQRRLRARVRRPQATRPLRQVGRSARHRNQRRAREARRTPRPAAASSKPSSCSTTAARPSAPLTWSSAATCCQWRRKPGSRWPRTGSISARRRQRVAMVRASRRRSHHCISTAFGLNRRAGCVPALRVREEPGFPFRSPARAPPFGSRRSRELVVLPLQGKPGVASLHHPFA